MLFIKPKGRLMQRCARPECGLWLKTTDSREVVDGKVYHIYCNWKIHQQAKEVRDAQTLRALLPDNPKGKREQDIDNSR